MNDAQIRMLVFCSMILVIHLLQLIVPSYKNINKQRILSNWLIFASAILFMRLLFPSGLAYFLYNQHLSAFFIRLHELPIVADLLLTILIFDFAIYWQHRFFHIIPFFWRYHLVHHCDTEMDYTTALRFHPLEILYSGLYKIALIALFSPRIESFLIYEMLLNSMAIFNHGNFKIAPKIEKILRWVIVTPQMHYPHHSPDWRLTNSNYGNTLSVWDRIFKSYTDQSTQTFGINSVNSNSSNNFLQLLKLPFLFKK